MSSACHSNDQGEALSRKFTRNLLLRMSIPCFMALTYELLFFIISGSRPNQWLILLSIVAVYGILQLAGTLVIFNPVRKILTGHLSYPEVRKRMDYLPIIMSSWTMVTGLTFIGLNYWQGRYSQIMDTGDFWFVLSTMSNQTLLFRTFMSVVIYFAIMDFQRELREAMSLRCNVQFTIGTEKLSRTIFLPWTLLAVLPFLQLAFRTYTFAAAGPDGVGQFRLIHYVIQFSLVSVLGIAIAAYFVARNIAGSIMAMTTIVDAISAGDYSREIPIARKDEIGRLIGKINGMVKNLRKNKNQHDRGSG